MNSQILIGFLLTLAPVSELRGGLPVIVEFCTRHHLPVWPYFLIVLLLNILVIFIAFAFLDLIHTHLLKWPAYKKISDKTILKTQTKAKKIERKMKSLGYLALMLFVSIPLPGTGAWTGSIVAWTLGLNRPKSFIAIALGVVVAGTIILFTSLGFFLAIN